MLLLKSLRNKNGFKRKYMKMDLRLEIKHGPVGRCELQLPDWWLLLLLHTGLIGVLSDEVLQT